MKPSIIYEQQHAAATTNSEGALRLYDIERGVAGLDPPERQRIRAKKSRKVADALHQ